MVKKDKKIEHTSSKALENFKLYAQGIKRLKQLEKELDELDTSKFKHEAHRIRSKLNNVSRIPEIEEDIRRLKLEIAGVDVQDLKSRTDKRQDVRLRELSKKEKDHQANEERKLRILSHQEKVIEEQISKLPAVRAKISFLKSEHEKVIHYRIPHLSERVKLLEKELEAAEALLFAKREQLSKRQVHNIHQIPAITRIIALIGKKLGYLHREAGILENQVHKSIQLTEKEKKDVGKIPLLARRLGNLKNFFVKKTVAFDEMVPNLVERTKLIEKAIVKTEEIVKRKQLRAGEKHDVDRIPYLKKSINVIRDEIEKASGSINSLRDSMHLVSHHDRSTLGKINYLRHKINTLETALDKEASVIPALQRRTGYIGRRVREEEKEIKEIDSKVDQNRLKFHEEMVNEIVESRRMQEEGKQEIRQQLLDLLAETVHRVNEQKKESDRKVLSEIEALKEELQKNKEEVNKKLNSKLSYIDKKVENEEQEINERILKEMNFLKEELQKTKNSSSQKITYNIHNVNEKIESEKSELEGEIQDKFETLRRKFSQRGDIPQLTSKGLEIHSKIERPNIAVRDALFDMSLNNIVPKREPQFMKRIEELEKSLKKVHMSKADFKKLKSEVTEEREIKQPLIVQQPDFEDIKKEVENNVSKMPEMKSLVGEKARKLKIPKKMFFDYASFAELSNEIDELKVILGGETTEIITNISEKREDFENEMEKIQENVKKTCEDLKKMNANFSWKVK